MKIGTITRTNQKGQIVIPKAMREVLGIDADVDLNLILTGEGVFIYPIDEVLAKTGRESSYLEVLKKTRGAWRKENWDSLRKRRKKIELGASRGRKKDGNS